MSKKNKNIEELFRKEFADYKAEPTPALWKGISRKLRWDDFMHFRWNRFNIFYGSAIIILSGLVMVSLLSRETDNNPDQVQTSMDQIKIADNNNTTDLQDLKDEKIKMPSESMDKTGKKKDIKRRDGKAGVSKEIQEPEGNRLQQEEKNQIRNQEINDVYGNNTFIAYFVPSVSSGCVPLQVEFTNSSIQGKTYSWSFGDGGQSAEKDPFYIYDEAGEFIVNLTVSNEDNEIKSFSQTILVYEVPEVDFKMEIQDLSEGGIPVYFYNQTKGASQYSWDFGDGGKSELSEPSWIYKDAGIYDIKLLAKSANGCLDSMILKNAFEEGSPEIIFPNAFSPNMNGPNGGYYSDMDKTNDVFHPWISEIPVEYQLKIFNRKGNLLFESMDLNIGWDGYYNQSLQPIGVYIYKIRAKFSDGKTVVKMGDLTLFHSEF